MSYKFSKNFRSWNEQTEQCLILDFQDDITIYNMLYYKTQEEEGFYAYSDNLDDLKRLRNDLVNAKRFKPTELTFTTAQNFKAIFKKRRELINV